MRAEGWSIAENAVNFRARGWWNLPMTRIRGTAESGLTSVNMVGFRTDAVCLVGRLSDEKPGVTKLPPQWNWIRYAIGGKMFAAVCLSGKNEPKYITLKLEPEEGSFLRGQYDDIIPGYYMNKQHWNSSIRMVK